MPIYRFEFSGNLEDGTAEVEFPDDEAARVDAVRAASEAIMAGYILDAANWQVRVFGPAGSVVATVTFTNVMNRQESSPPTARPGRM